MVGCPHTFDHTVYVTWGLFFHSMNQFIICNSLITVGFSGRRVTVYIENRAAWVCVRRKSRVLWIGPSGSSLSTI